MFNGYVMLARFPKGHVMDRHPGPLMVIPEQHWENFQEAIRPAMDPTGIVTNMHAFMESMRMHFPKIAEKIEKWGHGVVVQIWVEEVMAYSPIPRQEMQHAS